MKPFMRLSVLIVLAAATTAVALAIILNVYRRYKTVDPDRINHLKD